MEATVNSILREWRALWPGGLTRNQYSTLNLLAFCRHGLLGYNRARCGDCRHVESHARSCGDRSRIDRRKECKYELPFPAPPARAPRDLPHRNGQYRSRARLGSFNCNHPKRCSLTPSGSSHHQIGQCCLI